MATWTFSKSSKYSTITLSKKNRFLDINFDIDATNYQFDGEMRGNDLILSFFQEAEEVRILTIKNYASYMDNVWFKSPSQDDYLKNIFDQTNVMYMGNLAATKSMTVKGFESSEIIMAGRGNDKLYSNGGKDILMPGSGNDTIYAGNERNIYVLHGNFGQDTIYLNDSKTNIVTFYNPIPTDGDDSLDKPMSEGLIPITSEDLTYQRVGNDMKVIVNSDSTNTHGTLIFKDYFNLKSEVGVSNDVVSFLLYDQVTGWNYLNEYLHYTQWGGIDYLNTMSFVEVLKKAEIWGPINAAPENFSNCLTEMLTDAESKAIGDEFKTLGVTDSNYKKAINITDTKDSEYIYGGKGNDKFTIKGGDDMIYTGNGNNTVNVLEDTGSKYIVSGSGNDKITIADNANVIYINDVGGKNTITIGKNAGSFNQNGDEADVLYNYKYGLNIETYNGSDNIKIGDDCNGAMVSTDQTDGRANDTVTFGESADFVKVYTYGGNDSVTFGDKAGSYYEGSYDPDLTPIPHTPDRYGIYIDAGTGSDKIKLGEETYGAYIVADELEGNYNDSISVGNYSNRIEAYTYGGNDSITIGEYSGIFMDYDSLSNQEKYGIYIDAGNGSDTVKIGEDCQGAYILAGSDTESYRDNDNITIGENSKNIVVETGNGNDKIVAGNYVDEIKIDSGAGNDTIQIGKNAGGVKILPIEGFPEYKTLQIDSGEGNDKLK